MAVKSPLRPSSIVSERRIEPAKLGNFITGGSPLGESIVSSAANKIVGFQRGASGVAARPPDLGSIISTLSSSILNNVENRVQSINQNVTQIVGDRLGFYDKELKQRLDKTESAKPSGILSNFLKLYNQAIEYIQFLGNRKNIKTLGENIKELQKVFTETFEVAKVIRQTIVRIVKQLSNLPTASSSGGGLNLDIDVPGGPLRRSMPRGLANFGKMALAGGAVAGAGMLGGKVVSGMLDVGGEQVQPVAGSGSEGLSGPVLDRFSAILDRFSAAIDSLSRKPASKPSSPGGGKSTATPSAEPTTPTPTPSGSAVMPESDQELYTLATIAGLESGTAQGQADVAQAVYNRMTKGNTSATDILTRTGQFEPAFTAPYKISGGKVDPAAKNIKTFDDAVKFRMKKTGEKRETAEASIKSTIANLQNASLQQNAASFIGARTSFRGSPQNIGNTLSNSIWRGSRSDNQYLNEEISGKGTAAVPGFVAGISGKPTATTKPPSAVTAAPTQATTAQQVSQTVAQQPGANQPSKPLMVPINLGGTGGQTQPTPPPTPSPPPILNSSGVNVRSIASTNFDNFYTIHSRLTFNIVE